MNIWAPAMTRAELARAGEVLVRLRGIAAKETR